MANILSVEDLGNLVTVTFDDGTIITGVPTGRGKWLFPRAIAPLVIVDPVDPPPTGSTLRNPWGVGRGAPDDWESHASYSGGGYDWSGGALSYGGAIVAPGNGVLHTSGGGAGFEYAAGNQGSAGLRSILYLDTPVSRHTAKSGTLMNGSSYEAEGPITAVVFQHQSAMGNDLQHYNQNETLGFVGDSGNGVTHLHIHGLTASGARVDFFKFGVI